MLRRSAFGRPNASACGLIFMALPPKDTTSGLTAGLAVSQWLHAAGIWPVLILADIAGWVWLARSHASVLSPNSCGSSLAGWVSSGWSGAEAAVLLNPPGRLVPAWLLMVWAMMTPLLAEPIAHLSNCSPTRLRPLFIALFVASYAAIWLLAGFLLLGVALGLQDLARAAALPPPALAAAVALIWQASPLKQACVNSCHRPPGPPAGEAAVLDSLRYGVVTALWCVGACWALMLAPFVVDRMHFPLMATVAAVLFVERQAPMRRERWRWLPIRRLPSHREYAASPMLTVARRAPFVSS
jgi:predicted metal-binding membrane protein